MRISSSPLFAIFELISKNWKEFRVGVVEANENENGLEARSRGLNPDMFPAAKLVKRERFSDELLLDDLGVDGFGNDEAKCRLDFGADVFSLSVQPLNVVLKLNNTGGRFSNFGTFASTFVKSRLLYGVDSSVSFGIHDSDKLLRFTDKLDDNRCRFANTKGGLKYKREIEFKTTQSFKNTISHFLSSVMISNLVKFHQNGKLIDDK